MKTPISPSVHRAKLPDSATIDGVVGEALTYLANDSERLRRFFDITGLSVATLRRAANAPGFAISLLDYIAADDRLLSGFAAERGCDPAEIEAMRLALTPPPGDD